MGIFSSTCNWCDNNPCTCPKPTAEELARYHEECRIEMSNVYIQEGSPDAYIRDIIAT